MTLEIYIYVIWEQVLADSLKGINKSKIVCSAGWLRIAA
jgi:hypothetical protein